MQIRKSTVRGILYPLDKVKLEETIMGLMSKNEGGIYPCARAILSPHGCWEVFAPAMAAAFSAVRTFHPDIVILIGPVHREFKEKVFVPLCQRFETPLGDLNVASSPAKALCGEAGVFEADDIPHEEEHCLELQLPFIRYVYPDVPFLPLLIGRPKKQLLSKAAGLLYGIIGSEYDNPLFVITGNASAYLPFAEAMKEASTFLGLLENGIPSQILKQYNKYHHRDRDPGPCAAGPAAFLHLLLPGLHTAVLEGPGGASYNNRDKVVAAVSAVFEKRGI